MGCGASLEDGGVASCEAYTKWYELPAAAASSQWPAAPRKVFRGFTAAEDYELRFRFILRGTIGGWGSVVHFTASGDDSHWLPYGQRIPRIFVAPNSQKLCVVAGHEGNWNYHKYTRGLEIGAPVDVRVRLSGSTYEVFFGDQRVLGPSVHGARPSRSVSVYLGGHAQRRISRHGERRDLRGAVCEPALGADVRLQPERVLPPPRIRGRGRSAARCILDAGARDRTCGA